MSQPAGGWQDGSLSVCVCKAGGVPGSATEAIDNAHAWFEVNSGWAPPDPDELAEWITDGVCRCPDHCLVEPDGWCIHGLASWALILAGLDDTDAKRRHG